MSAAHGQVQASRLTGGLFFARLFKDLRKLYKTRKSHFKTHKIKCALCHECVVQAFCALILGAITSCISVNRDTKTFAL